MIIKNNSFKYHIYIDVLGVLTLFRCKHEECSKEIASYWAPRVVNTIWRSPDIIIDCDWTEMGRYLFRSRNPEEKLPLKGISVYYGNADYPNWESTDPPFPSFTLEPYKNRFIGLHGGAVSMPNGNALLVIGHSSHGKTTLVKELVNKLHCRLLTDETVCIHRRSCIVEPFPRAMGITSLIGDKEVKKEIAADKICSFIEKKPRIISHIFFLHKNPIYPKSSIEKIPQAAILRELLEHHVQTGCNLKEALNTLFQLANNVKGYILRHRGYNDLLQEYKNIYNTASM